MDEEAVDPLQAEVALARRIACAAPGVDREAEAGLYRLLAPRVRRYGLRHLRDAEAAADFMQHVMLKILEKLRAGALRDPEQIVSFVFSEPAAWSCSTCARGCRTEGEGSWRGRRPSSGTPRRPYFAVHMEGSAIS